MTARIVAGSANRALAAAIADALGAGPVPGAVDRFPDGELRPVIGHVRGEDVYVVQPTGPPVGDNLVELLFLLDACRRGGAGRITAVVPYFGYARQDRRGRAGEPVGVRVVADTVSTAGAHRLMVVDPHTAALEAVCGIPVEMLSAVPVLAAALTALAVPGDAVLVAPDLGAVTLAERYAAAVRRPVAVVRKTRVTGTTVYAQELVGDVDGRPTVIVDDMISTGGTIEAAARAILNRGGAPAIAVAATHGLLVGDALDRLARLPIRRVLVTDTVARPAAPRPPLQCESVAGLLATAIGRLNRDEPLDDLVPRL